MGRFGKGKGSKIEPDTLWPSNSVFVARTDKHFTAPSKSPLTNVQSISSPADQCVYPLFSGVTIVPRRDQVVRCASLSRFHRKSMTSEYFAYPFEIAHTCINQDPARQNGL